MDEESGALRGASLDGFYWSNSAHNIALYAYALYFNYTNVLLSYGGYRFDGFTVQKFTELINLTLLKLNLKDFTERKTR